MAVKKVKKSVVEAVEVPVSKPASAPVSTGSTTGRWAGFGWVLLLLGGLAHMLPEQMAPLMKWSLFGVSIQLAIGVVSVLLALNFLLED